MCGAIFFGRLTHEGHSFQKAPGLKDGRRQLPCGSQLMQNAQWCQETSSALLKDLKNVRVCVYL